MLWAVAALSVLHASCTSVLYHQISLAIKCCSLQILLLFKAECVECFYKTAPFKALILQMLDIRHLNMAISHISKVKHIPVHWITPWILSILKQGTLPGDEYTSGNKFSLMCFHAQCIKNQWSMHFFSFNENKSSARLVYHQYITAKWVTRQLRPVPPPQTPPPCPMLVSTRRKNSLRHHLVRTYLVEDIITSSNLCVLHISGKFHPIFIGSYWDEAQRGLN